MQDNFERIDRQFDAPLGEAGVLDRRPLPVPGRALFQRYPPMATATSRSSTPSTIADGIHDSLYRSGGSELLRTTTRRAGLQAA